MTVAVDSVAATTTMGLQITATPEIEVSSLLDIFALATETTNAVVAVPFLGKSPRRLLVSDLGWTEAEAAAIRSQLASFEEDWDAPGMDAYDAL